MPVWNSVLEMWLSSNYNPVLIRNVFETALLF